MINRAQSLLQVPRPTVRRPWSRHSNDGSIEMDVESGSRISTLIEDDFRTNLRNSLMCGDNRDRLTELCWSWYYRQFDDTIKNDYSAVLAPAIRGLDPEFPKPSISQQSALMPVYKVAESIVHAISNRENISVDNIIAELNTKQLLRAEDRDQLVRDQNLYRQMVWCMVGMITTLYDPRRSIHSEKLRLREPPTTLRSGGARRLRDLAAAQQDINNCRDPLHSLLTQFGDLIPQVEIGTANVSCFEQHQINISYINYYTLKNVAKIDIEWVNTLNSHLQLDKRKRILRLYRFPAFCRLIWSDTESPFMEKLFDDHIRSQVQLDGHDHTEHSFSDYLREIILSYRLLFGIDKKSQEAFKSEYENRHRNNEVASTTQSRTPIRYTDSSTQEQPRTQSNEPLRRLQEDPLLTLLATTDMTHTNHPTAAQTTLAKLLSELHGEEKSTLYDFTDFPFLGHRLADLQGFSLIQKPNDLKSVFWIDRRSAPHFWNSLIACALLLIGGGTIFLQFLQLVFQIWGTVIAHLQWKEGPG